MPQIEVTEAEAATLAARVWSDWAGLDPRWPSARRAMALLCKLLPHVPNQGGRSEGLIWGTIRESAALYPPHPGDDSPEPDPDDWDPADDDIELPWRDTDRPGPERFQDPDDNDPA